MTKSKQVTPYFLSSISLVILRSLVLGWLTYQLRLNGDGRTSELSLNSRSTTLTGCTGNWLLSGTTYSYQILITTSVFLCPHQKQLRCQGKVTDNRFYHQRCFLLTLRNSYLTLKFLQITTDFFRTYHHQKCDRKINDFFQYKCVLI